MSLEPAEQLQKETYWIQYTLRSSFFYHRRREFQQLVQETQALDSTEYDWTSPEAFGISQSSWEYIHRQRLSPCQIFCHPDVIKAAPELIAYYRTISVLSQKGVQRLAFAVQHYEASQAKRPLTEDRALQLARLFNMFMSAIIDSDPTFSLQDALLAGQLNFGTQLNGSWRNAIGTEGTRRVRELLLRYFLDQGLVTGIKAIDGSILPPSAPPASVDDVQGFTLTNGYQLIFGSEPDISLISPTQVLEGAIEVKAGIDPAGALERYGAAKKSFDRVLQRNKSAITIYLASCVTEGVKKAMADDRLVRKDFNLTQVFTDYSVQQEFLSYIRWSIHL